MKFYAPSFANFLVLNFLGLTADCSLINDYKLSYQNK